jgi:hypothetical protein
MSNTQVTGQILDPNGVPYANGRVVAFSTTFENSYPTTTDANGNIVGPYLLPQDSYNFVVSAPGVGPPLGTGSQIYTTFAVVVTGATQNLGSTLSANAPALTIPSQNPSAGLFATTTQTMNYTAKATDYEILGNTTGGAFTVTLPTTGITAGKQYRIKNIGSTAYALTVSSGVNIDYATTQTLSTQDEAVDVMWDGTQYWIPANNPANISETQRLTEKNYAVDTYFSAVVSEKYEIGVGFTTELYSDSTLEIL